MLFRVFRDTRGYTTSNLITTEGLMTWSSEVFRIFLSHFLIFKSCKNRKLKECFVWYFGVWRKREKVCVSFFTTVCNSSLTYTTYKPSHRSHTIIPLSNHHTIIILNSHNLRNICFNIYFKEFGGIHSASFFTKLLVTTRYVTFFY